jgi:hypothetical protein
MLQQQLLLLQLLILLLTLLAAAVVCQCASHCHTAHYSPRCLLCGCGAVVSGWGGVCLCIGSMATVGRHVEIAPTTPRERSSLYTIKQQEKTRKCLTSARPSYQPLYLQERMMIDNVI